ncbi:MAG: pitrilysin family protein [Chthoniobacter sp.]|uniref:M16 family metallopeptidase n=1 Tax=Chthoniobacter sp. TaxID=2510640 RepID=UPI0032AE429F
MRSTRLAALLLLAALLAFGRAAESIPPLKFEQRALPNGLQFIWLEDHSAPTACIQVWYRVGSKDDPAGRSGFAHLFEHMMFKSTKRMPAEFLDRLTEDVGGENNAYTADDVTVFHETVPANNLERLLWAEAERLSALTVDVHNFTLEREVVKEEYRQRILAEPYGEFGEFIQKKSFLDHPYKRPTIGNIAELDASNLEEVRAFHTTFYRPDNAVLVVVGDFDPAQLQGWVDQYFGAIPKPAEPIPRVTTKEPPRTAAKTLIEYDPKVPLPALAVTYLGPSITAEDAAPLRVAEQVLSGGESSRLYRKLVYETQLAQSAEFSADLRADLGLLTFEVVLASGVPVEKAKTVLFGEIAKITAKPISDAELTIARNQLLAAKLIERETFEGKASALGEAAAVYGDPNRANTDLSDLQAVTPAQVQTVAQKWFTPANQLVIEYLPEAMKTKVKGKK